MNCIEPLSIKMKSGERVSVPCNKCLNCLERVRSSWQFRLETESRHSRNAWFITLTYDNDAKIWGHHNSLVRYSLSEAMKKDDFKTMAEQLSKKDVQLFIKRLREFANEKNYNNIRYFISGEYGEHTLRAHYHAIIFNLPEMVSVDETYENVVNLVNKSWGKGFIHIRYAQDHDIGYITKYLLKTPKERTPSGRVKYFTLKSTKPGLGIKYVEENSKYHVAQLSDKVPLENGKKIALPRYYKKKIFTEKQLENVKLKSILESDRKIEYENNKYGLNERQLKILHEYRQREQRKGNKFRNEKF